MLWLIDEDNGLDYDSHDHDIVAVVQGKQNPSKFAPQFKKYALAENGKTIRRWRKLKGEEKKKGYATIYLDAAVAKFNADMVAAFDAVKADVDLYNDAVKAAEEFRADINGEQETYTGDRSEKWLEGDAGQQYEEWKSAWADQFEEIEVDEPEEVAIPEMDHGDNLDGLSSEPGT